MIEKIDSPQQYQTFLKLLGLWQLLIKELSDKTGYSKDYWIYQLKKRAGFGKIIKDKFNQEMAFSPISMTWSESTMDQRSQLFSNSFHYIQENDIIDLASFKEQYFMITGRELI